MAQVPDGFHRVNFNCPEETHALLAQHCRQSNRTMAKVLNEWILDRLNQQIPEAALRLPPDCLRSEEFQIEAPAAQEGHVGLEGVVDEETSSRLL